MQQAQSGKLHLSFVSDPAYVATIRKSIEQFCKSIGMDDAAVHEIGLVVNEALANVIRHAYAGALDKPMQVDVERSGGGVQISIRDWGNGIDPSQLQRPPRDLTKPGGLGLICMRQLMDHVEYQKLPDGILLRMKRTSPGARFSPPSDAAKTGT